MNGYQATNGRLITGMALDIDEGEVGGQGIGEPEFTSLDDLAFVAIPEPASLAMFGLGGLVMLARRRR